jgi:hypothetical protein
MEHRRDCGDDRTARSIFDAGLALDQRGLRRAEWRNAIESMIAGFKS